MSDYVLSCCSTADLTEEHFLRREISYVGFHYELGGVRYLDDLGKTIDFPTFYRAMADGVKTKTAPVSVDEFETYFEKLFFYRGKDILHVCLSSGLSDVMSAALEARKRLAERYPERQIFIVDSLGASSGYGLFMDQLADLRDAGYSLGELYEWAMSNRKKLNHWFFSTDLTYYVRGGRISRAAGSIGNALDICPLLNMDHAGHLVPRYKIRTKKRVIRAIVDQMESCARGHAEYDGKCYLSHSNCLQDARAVADLVEERFPRLDGKVEIYDVGTTIGSHTGPGTVALFFWGQERMD